MGSNSTTGEQIVNIPIETRDLFQCNISLDNNYCEVPIDIKVDQMLTSDAFSSKWNGYNEDSGANQDKLFDMQKQWYLNLFGFYNEESLLEYANNCKVIFDAGCGLGYKAKWIADMAPCTRVIGMDLSDAAKIAASKYDNTKNLSFIRGDIAHTYIKDNCIDYVYCDQVLHHTLDPAKTLIELKRVTKLGGRIAIYVYRKKAIPRELLDERFRNISCTNDEILEMSKQLTELGKTLTDLNITINVPDIPLLNIKGGVYDIQRFIYWNFLKCYWNKDLGEITSIYTNYDWYAPKLAYRFSEEELLKMIEEVGGLSILHLHKEEPCISALLEKQKE